MSSSLTLKVRCEGTSYSSGMSKNDQKAKEIVNIKMCMSSWFRKHRTSWIGPLRHRIVCVHDPSFLSIYSTQEHVRKALEILKRNRYLINDSTIMRNTKKQ